MGALADMMQATSNDAKLEREKADYALKRNFWRENGHRRGLYDVNYIATFEGTTSDNFSGLVFQKNVLN